MIFSSIFFDIMIFKKLPLYHRMYFQALESECHWQILDSDYMIVFNFELSQHKLQNQNWKVMNKNKMLS